jgi:hypothetical protein
MEPISPTTPINVTLEAQEWNAVLGLLAKAPYEVVANIITKMGQQAQNAAQNAGQPQAMLTRPNGAESHPVA